MANQQVQYDIGGMSCLFCAETMSKAYERTDGVTDVDVSLAHEELLVRYDDEAISDVEIRDVVRDLGYTVRDPDEQKRFEQQQEELEDGKQRLRISAVASVVSLLLMGVMVARNGWNVFAETDQRWMWYGSLALALITMFWPGRYIIEKAYESLRRGIFNQTSSWKPVRSPASLAGCSAGSSTRIFRWCTSSSSRRSSPPTTSFRNTRVSSSERGPRGR